MAQVLYFPFGDVALPQLQLQAQLHVQAKHLFQMVQV